MDPELLEKLRNSTLGSKSPMTDGGEENKTSDDKSASKSPEKSKDEEKKKEKTPVKKKEATPEKEEEEDSDKDSDLKMDFMVGGGRGGMSDEEKKEVMDKIASVEKSVAELRHDHKGLNKEHGITRDMIKDINKRIEGVK